jgi:hypothetical protein
MLQELAQRLFRVFRNHAVVDNYFPLDRVAQPAWYALLIAVVLVPLDQREEAEPVRTRSRRFKALFHSPTAYRAVRRYIVRHRGGLPLLPAVRSRGPVRETWFRLPTCSRSIDFETVGGEGRTELN